MKNRSLVEASRGRGRSVHTLQKMPSAKPRRVEQSLASLIGSQGSDGTTLAQQKA